MYKKYKKGLLFFLLVTAIFFGVLPWNLLSTEANHREAPTHKCHLELSDWWSAAMQVDYARTYPGGALMFVTLQDGCSCIVEVSKDLLDRETIILAGRQFIGAGYLNDDDSIHLEKVCDTFVGCVASRN